MASFSEDDLDRADWPLFQNGWVTLFWKPEVLETACKWLLDHGYRIHRFSADRWSSSEIALRELGETLSFPDYYGQNLNAFNDCLSDIDVPDTSGTAIVLLRYDQFAAIDRGTAHALLDIMAGQARQHMLFGRRLAILLQTDDPRISFGPLAPTHAVWNHREWLDKDRGL
jgi:RNAse (barnase) inhibitor barstar